MNEKLHILHLEDNLNDAELIHSMLERDGIEFSATVVEQQQEFVNELRKGGFDLIISDFSLPSFNGLSALSLAREISPHTPFIFVSGTLGEEAAINALKLGASDYVLKQHVSKVAPAVRRVMLENEERAKLKQAEEVLKESYQFIEAIAATTPNLLYVYDIVNKKNKYVNRKLTTLLGFSEEEIERIESNFLQLLMHPEDYGKTMDAFSKFSSTEEESIIEIECRFRNVRNEWRWFLSRNSVFKRTEEGAPTMIIGNAVDITERKIAEDTLKKQEREMRTLAENVPDIIARFDKELRHVFVNDLITLKTGIPAESFIGKTNKELNMPEHIVAFWDENLGQVFQTSQPKIIEFEFPSPDGNRFYESRLIPEVGVSGTTETVLTVIRDITERKQAEEQIREQAALIDIDPDAIIVRDMSDRILFWNKGAERLYGWTKQEAIGTEETKLHFKYEEKKFFEAKKILLEKDTWDGEYSLQTNEGKKIEVEARWTLVRDHEGNPKSIYVVNTDVTEKKKIEAQFMRAQRMESIGTLAGGIAHDLNNVLAPILIASQILKKKYMEGESQKMLSTIERSAQRGAGLIKQVLSFARGVEGERVLMSLRHLINELERIMQETFPKSILITSDIPKDFWPVHGDPTQIDQILLNLCVNARDAMPNGGTLSMTGENVFVDENYAHLHIDAKPGPYSVITITDSGTGIPRELQEKIFEPFFTTKGIGKGTGLGLSTVYSIVKNYGGFINLYSEVGKGTRFKIYLPSVQSKESKEAEEQIALLPSGDDELILVIDDETSIREIAKITLETFNYRVLVANDGAEAIAIYGERKNEIKAVILDMNMPVMDGPLTVRALRKVNPAVRIIGTSGLAEEENLTGLKVFDVQFFLQKPFTAEKLLTTLHDVLKV